MKVCVTGKAVMQFTDEETGEKIEGAKLYYMAPKDEVEGFFSGDMWIKRQSRIYDVLMSLDTKKPFMAELEYDEQPGKRRPVFVMVGIRPLERDELDKLSDNVFWKEFVWAMT